LAFSRYARNFLTITLSCASIILAMVQVSLGKELPVFLLSNTLAIEQRLGALGAAWDIRDTVSVVVSRLCDMSGCDCEGREWTAP
jgi:hypothetical protein